MGWAWAGHGLGMGMAWAWPVHLHGVCGHDMGMGMDSGIVHVHCTCALLHVQFAVDWPLAAACLMGLIHLAMLVGLAVARPYMDQRPDQLSIAISFANVFNAAMAGCAFARVELPEWIAGAATVGIPGCNHRHPRLQP